MTICFKSSPKPAALLKISEVALKCSQPQGSRSGQKMLAESTWQLVYIFLKQVLPVLM